MSGNVTGPKSSFKATIMLFLAAFALSQADKQVVGLLASPIKQAFALSDSQLGLLQGVGFALAFAIGGLPIGRLVDGGNRIRIAAACIACWSIATIACGLAGSFLMLFALRATTAVAEAGLSPAFFSIMSQDGNRRRLLRITSVFMLAPFVGGGSVLLIGGALLRMAAHHSADLPVWLTPWRVVFLAIGIPGIPLALSMIVFAREPDRQAARTPRTPVAPIRSVLSRIFIEDAFLRIYYAALLMFTLLLYSLIAWYPSLLTRKFAMSFGEAGASAGTVYLIAGVLGTLSINALATFRDVDVRKLVKGYFLACMLLIPIALATALAPSAGYSLAAYAAYAFLSAALLASMPVPIQLGLPNMMVGRGIAIFSFVTSAIAGSMGPLLVGLLTDRAGISLGAALAITGGCAMTVATGLFWSASRRTPLSPTQPHNT